MTAQKKNNLIVHPMVFSIPFVHELMLPIKTIRFETQTLDALALFDTDPDLPALSLIDEHNQSVGVITRRNYLNRIPLQIARELFAHTTLKGLLKIDPTVFTPLLLINADDRLNEVMLDCFNSEHNSAIFDVLPVKSKEGIIGVIKIVDITLKLFESQNTLINDMMQLSVRLKGEVDTAATLQQNLLRPSRIELPGIRGLATLITSSEIGGDFYDYYTVDARWIVMMVGDVSGHGVASGTIVSAAKASVNMLETDKEKEPHIILERLSNTILDTARQSLLMTMFVVCLDTQSGELRYANAGHQLPYLYRSLTGQLDMLEAVGLPLGKVENISYEQDITEMDVGDRLFLYSDAIVEEENASGDCFGYDRLEALLAEHIEDEPEVLRDRLLENFANHVGGYDFNDDVTIFCIEFYERQHKTIHVEEAKTQDYDLIRLIDSIYRAHPETLPARVAKQNIVFFAESNFSDLIPNLAKQGIRRVLVRNHTISRQLGWDNLQQQHLHFCADDLAQYLNHRRQNWEFQISGSDDKTFIIEELEAWLVGMPLVNRQRVDAAILILNKLIDNGIFDAPRDGRGELLYLKNRTRSLANNEALLLNTSIQDKLLGISLTDNWGSLSPSLFLNCLTGNMRKSGEETHSGLYTVWRLSDYLQIRVLPGQQTQICAFLDLKSPLDPTVDNGFQFLYHTENQETIVVESALALDIMHL